MWATVLVNLSSFSHSFVPLRFFLCCLALSVTPLFPPKKWGPRQILFSWSLSLDEKSAKELAKEREREKERSQGPLNRGETVGGHAIFPPFVPVWYQRGGWQHKQGFPSLPLFLLALLCQTCCNLDYTNSSKATVESLTCMGQAVCTLFVIYFSLYNTGSHVLVYKEPQLTINWVRFLFTTLGGSRERWMTKERPQRWF